MIKKSKKKIVMFLFIIITSVFLCSIFNFINESLKQKYPCSTQINFENDDEKFVSLGKNFLRINESGIFAYNSNGKALWKNEFKSYKPFVDVSKNYTILSARRGKILNLYKKNKLIKTIKTEHEIITAKVSKNGNFLVLISEQNKKNKIAIYNRRGKILNSWALENGNTVDAAITKNGKNICVSKINVEDNKVFSNVLFFNVNKPEAQHKFLLENALISKLQFRKNFLISCSETGIMGTTKNGKTKFSIDFDNSSIKEINLQSKNLIAYMAENDGNLEIKTYTNKGKNIGNFNCKNAISSLEIVGKNIVFSSMKNIIIINRNGKIKKTLEMPYVIKDICKLKGKRVLVVGNTRANIIKLRGENKFEDS